ncbi:hypothetical protein PsorP6_011898 [Peronosclerospora sorghi]|uniref:Uncharacterized protein n=1 Tax=Peronosclerospora sorghi TaxID=230839 RepID=A0ACC0WL26_9STRA|nr:hypothetical protein PsorP6_011898 [Peronosclerospora sorghi]
MTLRQYPCLMLLVRFLVYTHSSRTLAHPSKSVALYNDSECTTTALNVHVTNASSSCKAQTCRPLVFGTTTYYYNTSCSDADAHTIIATAFTGTRHIVIDRFRDASCSPETYTQTHAIQDLHDCVPFAIDSISDAPSTTAIASILAGGGVTIVFFPTQNCSFQPQSIALVNSVQVVDHSCYQASKFYVNVDVRSSSSSSFSRDESFNASVLPQSSGNKNRLGVPKATLVSALAIAAMFLVSALGFVLWKWRSTALFPRLTERSDSVAMLEVEEQVYLSKQPQSRRLFLPQPTTSSSTYQELTTSRAFTPAFPPTTTSFGSCYHRSNRKSRTNTGATRPRPWEDDFVVAFRIPREQILVKRLISRGGFGIVYSGLYKNRPVAIKMLLPETRRNIAHVVDLLAEVKMMAAMEHAHIVKFIGVAWDTLTNMCVVSELMAGGDLKALLSTYEEQRRPRGFNRQKLQIALHVAHALTYMHSMDPPIIHRDLKSKNVLLNENLEAKLTDFGTSRERVNEYMTGGVGTCLWMAPEVMLGNRYDDKADMFSFGVVLSELDRHACPYKDVKDPTDSNRQMPEPAILQMIVTGKLRVQFSNEALRQVVMLGLACVSLDPHARPTASEALFQLHMILAAEDDESEDGECKDDAALSM